MRISNFIVTDDVEKVRRKGQCALNGQVYIQIGSPVPVIRKGKGCIGIGIVVELVMREESTLVKFDFESNISDASKRAYYDLYRNQATVDDSGDAYDNSDVIIPGAIGSIGKGSGPKPNWSPNVGRRDSSPSLVDIAGDDFDNDPYTRKRR